MTSLNQLSEDCPLVAHFLPYFPENPYQPLLRSALHEANIPVETTFPTKLHDKSSHNAGSINLLHVHWLPTVTRLDGNFRKNLAFIRNILKLKKLGMPLVWTTHNLTPHESRLPMIDLWIARIVARLADQIICHSSAARDEVISRLVPNGPEKVRVIPHGHYIQTYPNEYSREQSRQKLSLQNNDIVFLFLGRIREYKGVPELLTAFRTITTPHAKLVIAGKPYTAMIDAEIRKLIGDDRRIVYHPGFISDAEIQIYNNAADVVVFPYRKSLTSGAIILAMSFSRACICPKLPGTTDCIGEEGAFLYDPENPEGLKRALQAALGSSPRLTAMGIANYDRAITWNWSMIGRETAKCYREAIGNRSIH